MFTNGEKLGSACGRVSRDRGRGVWKKPAGPTKQVPRVALVPAHVSRKVVKAECRPRAGLEDSHLEATTALATLARNLFLKRLSLGEIWMSCVSFPRS